MRVKILGRWWKLEFVPRMGGDLWGECESPDTRGKHIRVKRSLRGEDRLNTLIHEMLHAAGWPIDEDFVTEFGTDCARTLWRLGYRCEDEK